MCFVIFNLLPEIIRLLRICFLFILTELLETFCNEFWYVDWSQSRVLCTFLDKTKHFLKNKPFLNFFFLLAANNQRVPVSDQNDKYFFKLIIDLLVARLQLTSGSMGAMGLSPPKIVLVHLSQ